VSGRPRHRVAVARLWFEGNRFSPSTTGFDDFVRREWRAGAEALDAAAGTATELGAVADARTGRPGWSLEALRCASASPGGPIEEAVFGRWLDEVTDALRRRRPDGVYLSLHGAAITTVRDAPDLDVVRAVRAAAGPVPIVATFDLHANLPADIAADLDFATGYRTYPHVDMRETATRALDALAAMLDGAPRWQGAVVPLGCLLPSFNMRTDDEPMRSLQALARAAERDPPPGAAAIDASLFGGFPYADTAHTGASAMAWVQPAAAVGSGAAHAQATRIAGRLAGALAQRAADFEPHLLAPRAALLQALAVAGTTVAVTDPADNPLSGGGADTPGLFAALLALRREPGSALARLPAGAIVFGYFADAALVARAAAAGPGAVLDATLGARHGPAFGAAVPVRARVLRLTDGRFVNVGPMERGATVDLGPTALLEVDGVRVVVTSAVGPANDPAFFALHGIDVGATRLLCVKAKNHFRAAFGPLTAAIVDADCPGPAAADLSSLPIGRAPGAVSRSSRPTSSPPRAT
jgi:microcystin degradation protein MlrC